MVVHTTSQGFAMDTQTPSNPASTMRLAKERAESVVQNSSPSRLPAAMATLPAALTMMSHEASSSYLSPTLTIFVLKGTKVRESCRSWVSDRTFCALTSQRIEFVGQALQKQAVGDVRANVSQTDDANFTC